MTTASRHFNLDAETDRRLNIAATYYGTTRTEVIDIALRGLVNADNSLRQVIAAHEQAERMIAEAHAKPQRDVVERFSRVAGPVPEETLNQYRDDPLTKQQRERLEAEGW